LDRIPRFIAFICFDRNAMDEDNVLLESTVTICKNDLTVLKEEISLLNLPRNMEDTSYEIHSVKGLEFRNYDKDVEVMEGMVSALRKTNKDLRDTIAMLQEKTKNRE